MAYRLLETGDRRLLETGDFRLLDDTYTVPGAPTGLTLAVLSPTKIRLTWVPPVHDGGLPLTSRIEADAGAGFFDLEANTLSSDTEYEAEGLTPATEYTFRVSSINTEGTGDPSSEEVATTDVAAIGFQVSDTGLLFRDNFNRTNGAPGAPWEDQGDDTTEIVSNALKVPAVAAADFTGVKASDGSVAGRTTLFSQVTARQNSGAWPPYLAHLSTGGNGYSGIISAEGYSELAQWDTDEDNASLDTVAGAFSPNTDYTLQLYTADGVQTFFATKNGGTVSLSDTDTFADGQAKYLALLRYDTGGGVDSGNAALFDNAISCKSRVITVTGLQTGQKVQLLGTADAVLATATESGGTATLAVSRAAGVTEFVPYDGWTRFRVLDASNDELATGTLESGVYPGASMVVGPYVTITSPEDGSSIVAGEAGNLVAEAFSLVDGDISGDIEWESDIDGALGTGASISYASLTPGTHVITAAVTDSEALEASASITLIVLEAPPAGDLVNCYNSDADYVYWDRGIVPPPNGGDAFLTAESDEITGGALKVTLPPPSSDPDNLKYWAMRTRVGYDLTNKGVLVEFGSQAPLGFGEGLQFVIGDSLLSFQVSLAWTRVIADPIEDSSWIVDLDFGDLGTYTITVPDLLWWVDRFWWIRNLGPREWRVCFSRTGLPGSWSELGHGFSLSDLSTSQKSLFLFSQHFEEDSPGAHTAEFYINGINCGTAPTGTGCNDPVNNPGSPCTLEWTLFREDGVTVRAQSTTSPDWLGEGDAKKYLREPTGYGEQEVDFTAGTASLAQVNIRHVDVPTVRGDQDSGWFTDLLPHVAGNRNRLRRYTAQGWVTIADGPGSFPQLSETFAGFTHEIMDTREKERRLKAFVTTDVSVLPPGPLTPWGGAAPMLPAAEPVVGLFSDDDGESYPEGTGGYFSTEAEIPLGAAQEAIMSATQVNGRYIYKGVSLRWRNAGETEDDWRYIRNIRAPVPAFQLFTVSAGVTSVWVTFEQDGGYEVPAPSEDPEALEFQVLFTAPVSNTFPYLLDYLTAGEFLKNLYDGVYSPRDSLTGDPVPTGIRYDEDALLAMVHPVRLRITETVKNVREWAEQSIYLPLGYAPAFDNDGAISPRSDIIPSNPDFLNALTVVDNDNTQGVPGHAPGDNVINVLSFKYQRAYLDPDREETEDFDAYSGSDAVDGLSMQDVERTEDDSYSFARFGEQSAEIETVALVALGELSIDPLTGRQVVVSLEDSEEGYKQFFQRYQSLFLRRVIGTDLVVVPVMRAYTSSLRVGDWVRCKLSWIPNQDTGRRAVDHLAQILAIGETDCAWREMTMELVRDWDSAFDLYDSDYGLDEYGNFDPAFLQFAISPQAPVDGSEFVTIEMQSNVAPDGWRPRLLARWMTELIGGGDVQPFPETDITTALDPPAAFQDLPLAPGTTYQWGSGFQRNDATPTRHVTMDFRFQVLDQDGVVQIDSEDYPFPTEWDY